MTRNDLDNFFKNALTNVSIQKQSDINEAVKIYTNSTNKNKAIYHLAKMYNKTIGTIKFTLRKNGAL